VRATCDFATGCRRRIAWPLDHGVPLHGLSPEKSDLTPAGGEMPVLCLEGCNWLVTKARSFLQSQAKPTPG
jgi:hypothetical protein